MRLTLRTMLAFMDEILEPDDAQTIGKKIQESEFATSLLHRIRDVMRRLRLGAPNVTDHGAGLDPNTVAEYLDNTLPNDRVPDFEKVCLESDVHLAEVASCHQVLTLVVGEPAEVNPASRQRMYRLPEVVAAEVRAGIEAAESAADEQPAGETAAASRRNKRAVPDYLRGTMEKRRLWPAVVAVVAALFFGVLVLQVLGQFKSGSLLGSLLGFGPAEEIVARTPEATEPGGDVTEGHEQPEQPEAESPAEPAAPTDPANGAEQPPSAPVADPGGDQPVEGSTPASDPFAAQPGPDDVAVSIPRVEPGEMEPGGLAEPAGPGPDPAGTPVPPGEPGGGPVVPPGTPPAPGPADQPPAEPAPLPPERVGQLDSIRQILLRYSPESANWQRMPNVEALISGDVFLSLPAYRPSIVVAAEMRVDLVGGSRIQMQPTDAEGISGVLIDYGRLVVETAEAPGIRLRLQFGDRSGVVTFIDPESILAVDVARAYGSNADPETQPAPVTVDLYAAKGKILWQEGADRNPVAVSAPVRLTLNELPLEAVAVQQFPAWIRAGITSPLDQRAAGTLEEALSTESDVFLVFREMADHRQKEVRWLALRCLAAIADFQLVVDALDDPDHKPLWPDYIELLRATVRRSPLAAAQVRTAMEKRHGSQEGASLYEMLWRYPDRGIDAQQAAQLVRYLDHPTLAFRVLSFWNLKRITGLGLYYEPDETAAKRQPSIRKWKDRLNSGAALRSTATEEEGELPGGVAPPPEEGVLPGVEME